MLRRAVGPLFGRQPSSSLGCPGAIHVGYNGGAPPRLGRLPVGCLRSASDRYRRHHVDGSFHVDGDRQLHPTDQHHGRLSPASRHLVGRAGHPQFRRAVGRLHSHNRSSSSPLVSPPWPLPAGHSLIRIQILQGSTVKFHLGLISIASS